MSKPQTETISVTIELTATEFRYIERHMVRSDVDGRGSVSGVATSMIRELLADDMAQFAEEMESAVRSAEAAI